MTRIMIFFASLTMVLTACGPARAQEQDAGTELSQDAGTVETAPVDASTAEVAPVDAGSAQTQPYKIGVLLPRSERFPDVTERTRALFESARQALAERGGPAVELVYKEDLIDGTTSVKNVRTLIDDDHVAGIVGPMAQASAATAAPEAAKSGVPLLAFSRQERRALDNLLERVVREQGLKTVAIFWPDKPEGARFHDLFLAAAAAAGVKVVADAKYQAVGMNMHDVDKLLAGSKHDPKQLAKERNYCREHFKRERFASMRTICLRKAKDKVDMHPNFDALFIPDALKNVNDMVLPSLYYRGVDVKSGATKLLGIDLWDLPEGQRDGMIYPEGFRFEAQIPAALDALASALTNGLPVAWPRDPRVKAVPAP